MANSFKEHLNNPSNLDKITSKEQLDELYKQDDAYTDADSAIFTLMKLLKTNSKLHKSLNKTADVSREMKSLERSITNIQNIWNEIALDVEAKSL